MNFIVVARNLEMYDRLVRKNRCCKGGIFCLIDNRKDNNPISVCYNKFLNQYDYSKDSWLVFCHEDFEFQQDVGQLLSSLDKMSLHGVVGGVRRGFCGFGVQVIYGNMTEINRDGSGKLWNTGRKISAQVEVEAFDCCCLIVHSSLIAKFGLRFDENLLFDLYVEDFCAMAKVKYGIKSYVQPVKCCHHSGSMATRRLYRHLPYLESKYPKNYFVGTLVYFGTPSWQKRLQDWIIKRQGKL